MVVSAVVCRVRAEHGGGRRKTPETRRDGSNGDAASEGEQRRWTALSALGCKSSKFQPSIPTCKSGSASAIPKPSNVTRAWQTGAYLCPAFSTPLHLAQTTPDTLHDTPFHRAPAPPTQSGSSCAAVESTRGVHAHRSPFVAHGSEGKAKSAT